MLSPFPVRFWTLLLAVSLGFSDVAGADPIISEFMADNVSTIADEDGAYTDWIEIHNPDATPVDLTNWCLTDNAATLGKWRFPAVTLAPGDFLIVWASGKNRRVVGQPLHTNFSLSAGGEYLALVKADGLTIAQQFSPEYPPQDPNRAYGVSFNTTTAVPSGATARYLIPSSNAVDATWKQTGFSDAAWASGATGIGYGLMVPGITIRQVHKNTSYGGLASVAETDALLALAPGSPQIKSEATVLAPVVNILGEGSDGHYGANQPFPNPAGGYDYWCIKATGWIQIPTAGAWTFGINSDDGSRIRIDGANVMVDNTNHGPTDFLGTVTLTAGLHSFEVIMWEGAGGDEVEFYAAPGSFTTWNTNMRLVGDTASGGLAAYTMPSGAAGGGVIRTNIESTMKNVRSTAYVRVPFTASNVANFNSLSLRMRYNDGFVAYLNGAEIARRNAPASPAWDSAATAARTSEQSLVTEAINVTSALPSLINGNNVLAIHGLNVSAGDNSFLVLPELAAGSAPGGDPVYFTSPTPGSINSAASSLGKVADTQFSTKRGFFTAPFALTITTPTAGAQIRYTTDGSAPTASTGTAYAGPITINRTTILRAAAFKTGWDPTDVDTQTYLFLDDVIRQSPNGEVPTGFSASGVNGQVLNYGMDPQIVDSTNPEVGGAQAIKNAILAIPTMSLVTPQANLWNASTGIYVNPGGRGFSWERPCSLELLNDPAGGFQVNAGVRIRGGFSRSADNPKHSFHLYFRTDYGNSKLKYPLFGRYGVEEFDQIDLRTAQNYSWSFGGDSNNTFLREEFARDSQGAMGQPYSRGRYYHLFLNGQYWGLYNTQERTEASYAESYLGGDKDNYDVVKCEQSAGYTTGVTDGNLNAWQDLWTKARAHAASPTNANYFKMMGRAADGVTPTADPVLLDVDNLADYMLLTFWTGNLDGATSNFLGNDRANNWFGARDRTGNRGFAFFAHDFEHTLFNTNEDRTGPFIVANQNNFTYSNPMFLHQDLMGNIEYKTRFGDRVHKHLFNGGALTPPAATARINSLAPIVDSAIRAESARWGDSKTEPPKTRLDWRNARDYLLNSYIPVRGNTVLAQLRTDGLYPTVDAPVLNQFGGYISSGTQVLMTATAGTIYYTLDGSDPRLLGGAINPAAKIYTSSTANETPIPLSATGWKYLADGSNQGTAWRQPGFNDAAWPTGAAELGYGDGDEATTVPFVDVDPVTTGTQKNATTYFRKTFTVTNPGGVTSASINIEYDDAAAVYLNGTEIARLGGLPANPSFDAYVATSIEDTTVTVPFSPALLLNGTNTIAVEVHQAGNASSDISFNLSLTTTRSTTATPLFLSGPGEKQLKARALNGSNWSALDDALFLVDTVASSAANLAITEIMYRPADPSAAEIAAGFSDAGLFEYIELMNTGSQLIDLGGLYFSAGIDFDFNASLLGRTLAPGARILLVANKAAFEFRYGTGKPIAGEFGGSLNNAGETITLLNASNGTIRSLDYDDIAPWPAEGDSGGYSLVLRRPGSNQDPSQAANWRVSAALGGNPATSDSLTYAAWKTANGITNDAADTDGDGANAWFEYALGGSPSVPDSAIHPIPGREVFLVGVFSEEYATLTFTRRTAADDVDYIVEMVDQLTGQPWNGEGAVLVSNTRNANGNETLKYRAAAPISSTAGKQFLRLRATLAP
jgi:hypothetical protein